MPVLRLFALSLIGLLIGEAVAQVNVSVEVNAQDELGTRLATAFRDSVKKRRIFQVTPDPADADVTFKVGTIDPMDGKMTGQQSVFSLVITMKTIDERRLNLFVNNYLGVCGRDQVVQCGVQLADAAEQQVSLVLSALKARAQNPSAAQK